MPDRGDPVTLVDVREETGKGAEQDNGRCPGITGPRGDLQPVYGADVFKKLPEYLLDVPGRFYPGRTGRGRGPNGSVHDDLAGWPYPVYVAQGLAQFKGYEVIDFAPRNER